MTLIVLGGMTTGVALPGAALAVTAGIAGIDGAVPDIAARIAALADFAPAEISLTAELALAQQTITAIQATIASGLPIPSISAQIDIAAAQLAVLQAKLEVINTQRAALVSLQGSLDVGGIAGYVYEGPLSSLGDELDAEVGGIPLGVHAVVLVATNAPAWSALQAFMRVS